MLHAISGQKYMLCYRYVHECCAWIYTVNYLGRAKLRYSVSGMGFVAVVVVVVVDVGSYETTSPGPNSTVFSMLRLRPSALHSSTA
jgi:hypothetical protein